MDRRTFLVTTTAAAATTTVVADSAAAREQQVTAPAIVSGLQQLTFSSAWTADVPVFGDMAIDLNNRLQTALGDRYSIVVRPDAMTESDLIFSTPDAIAPSELGFAFFDGLPGSLGLSAHEHQAWLTVGGGQMLWDDLSTPHGWKPLLAGHTGPAPGLWTNRAIHSKDNLAGCNIGSFGPDRRVVHAIGATPVELPPAELTAALHQGRLGAAAWGNPLAALMLGLPNAASHYYRGGIRPAGTVLALNVRAGLWDQFSASDRAIFEGVAASMFAISVAEAQAHHRLALDAVVQSAPALTIADLPAAVSGAIDQIVVHTVSDIAAGSPDNMRIRQSFDAFSQLMRGPETRAMATS